MSVTRRRKAQKAHRCDGCGRPGKIQPGDHYLTHTALRGDDAYHDSFDRLTWKPANRPQRYAECGDCAIRHGRGELMLDG
jgi:hypothetical protein